MIEVIRGMKGDWNGKRNLKHNFMEDNFEVGIRFSTVGTSNYYKSPDRSIHGHILSLKKLLSHVFAGVHFSHRSI